MADTQQCPHCLSEVPATAFVCPRCTRKLIGSEAVGAHVTRGCLTLWTNPEFRSNLGPGIAQLRRTFLIGCLLFVLFGLGMSLCFHFMPTPPPAKPVATKKPVAAKPAEPAQPAEPPKPADDLDFFVAKYGKPAETVDRPDGRRWLVYLPEDVRAVYARDANGAWTLVRFQDHESGDAITAATVRQRLAARVRSAR